MRILIVVALSLFMVSCGNQKADLPALDLMSKGLPIKINAPQDADVEVNDYGLMKDVTVKKEEGYYLQIFSSDAMVVDVAKIKAEKMVEVKKSPSFSKIVKEQEDGFIYEKFRSDSTLNYDFRHVRIQGDKQYIFQTGLIGKFSLDDVETMYQSVQ